MKPKTRGRRPMRSHLFAGAAAVLLLVGTASAQPYPPPPAVPVAPPPAVVVAPPPAVVAPAPPVAVAPAPDAGSRTTTVTHGVDIYGNPVTKKETYSEGVAGSTETRRTTRIDPDTGTATTHTTIKNNP